MKELHYHTMSTVNHCYHNVLSMIIHLIKSCPETDIQEKNSEYSQAKREAYPSGQ